MRLTEKQVIEFEQAEKAQQLLDNGKITLGEFETMVQANNREITVTLAEGSHKHAEMMIHTIANPELVVFVKEMNGMKWNISSITAWNGKREYYLCHPNHEKECLHWLNGGSCAVISKSYGFACLGADMAWNPLSVFMDSESVIKIKQEPEYVKVESIYDLNRDEQYYFRGRPGEYLAIEHATEDYILLQLNGGGLYRKVEKGE
jgi:hypothetical protein